MSLEQIGLELDLPSSVEENQKKGLCAVSLILRAVHLFGMQIIFIEKINILLVFMTIFILYIIAILFNILSQYIIEISNLSLKLRNIRTWKVSKIGIVSLKHASV